MGVQVDHGAILAERFLEALRSAASRITEEEVEAAKVSFERRLREAVGGIAFTLHREISVRRDGDFIVLTCRLEEKR